MSETPKPCPFCGSCDVSERDDLARRIGFQTGAADATDAEWDAWDEAEEAGRGKVRWIERGADFGSPVVVYFDDTEEHGYLTTLPGFDGDGPDMAGVIHLPHTAGDKCDAGPVWMTVADMAALPFVTRIEIGRKRATPTPQETWVVELRERHGDCTEPEWVIDVETTDHDDRWFGVFEGVSKLTREEAEVLADRLRRALTAPPTREDGERWYIVEHAKVTADEAKARTCADAGLTVRPVTLGPPIPDRREDGRHE